MHVLIMAGGQGTRFWPKSRRKHPKQLLRMFGEQTLIQATVSRLDPLISPSDTYIVSTDNQIHQIKAQIPTIPGDNFIVEPKGKNTAPCIGLGALFLERADPDGVMVVLPADHIILDTSLFHKTLQAGARLAEETDSIVTIGIEPSYPATGYGYIQCNERLDDVDGIELFKVKTFAEKPDLATAKRFIDSGDFLWNSGIFVWKIKTILREIEEHLPHLHQGLRDIQAAIGTPEQDEVINRVYCQIRSTSIDYGVMEEAGDVKVLKASFGWDDLGSWDAVYKLSEKDEEKNVLVGTHIIKDSSGCYVDVPGKCVALLGMQDLVIVESGDVLLVCPRDRAQDVKELVDEAKRRKLDKVL